MSYKYLDQDKYKLIREAFFGSGGFYDGSYLVRHPAEHIDNYQARIFLASYSNYMKQVVEANITPVFSTVERKTENEMIQVFLNDCDGNGTSYAEFMKSGGIEAERDGFDIFFFDSDREQPKTEKEAKKHKTYPKIKKINAEDIEKYRLDGENNITYFRYKSDECDGVDEYTVYDNYIDYMPDNEQRYEFGLFYTATKETINNVETMKPIKGTAWPALHKPEILSFEMYPDQWTLPESRYATVAQTCQVIYNHQSCISYQVLNNTVTLLWNPNAALEDNVSLAAMNIWNSKPGAQAANGQIKPEYLSPEDGTEAISRVIDRLIEQIYETMNLNILSTSADASGESREESDKIRIEGLKSKSNTMADFDKKMISIFASITGMKTYDYIVEYPTDFAAADLKTKLEQGNIILQNEEIPEEIKEMIFLKMILQYFPNASAETKKKIITILEQTKNTPIKTDSLD